MTPNDYWKREIAKARDVIPELPDEIVAALIVASQLRDFTTRMEEIRVQLQHIEDSIANN